MNVLKLYSDLYEVIMCIKCASDLQDHPVVYVRNPMFKISFHYSYH